MTRRRERSRHTGNSANTPRATKRSARLEPDSVRGRILRAIEEYFDEHGYAPTNREIGAAVGIGTPSLTDYHLGVLEEQGYLTRRPGVTRGLTLTRPRGVPIRGRIAAGAPLELFDPGEVEILDIGHDGLARYGDVGIYALRVAGDSMIEDGILDGDVVLIREGAHVPSGGIAVALDRSAGERGAATLKRIFKSDTHVRLQPANSAHTTREINKEDWDRDWEVQGTLIAVYRRYEPWGA